MFDIIPWRKANKAMLLEIKDLYVQVEDREVLKGVDLAIDLGEVHVLMGPNASGKTTLVKTITGYPGYKVTSGRIFFKSEDLLLKDISERAISGIALAYQNPPQIRGVKFRDLLRIIAGREPWNPLNGPEETFATELIVAAGLDADFANRDLNIGFSGGERKRAELVQVFAMRPDLMILDEPDSGVDIDSLKAIGKRISEVVSDLGCCVLVITHHRHILQYLRPDVAHLIYGGKIMRSGNPEEMIPRLEELGYEGYVKHTLGASR